MLKAVRYGLPAVIVLAGLIALVVEPDSFEGALAIVGAGLSVGLLNFLHRIGADGETDRHDEAAARTYFDAHGRWPDEDDGERAA